jgi:GMP synthase (glutamine-hydrolysing)
MRQEEVFLRFLIIDGYAPKNREQLNAAGMTHAAGLHAQMLQRLRPDAACDVVFPSDPGAAIPSIDDLTTYAGIIWTGCDKSMTDGDDPDVERQLDIAHKILQTDIPSWGTCWGIQIMAVAAGGEVRRNPDGRHMGLARKIMTTPEGKSHPMYAGKSDVFDALCSHLDIVTNIPPGAVVLAGNNSARVQALAFQYGKGFFWGVQYHPDYSLHEVARLMVVRKRILISEGFFKDERDFDIHIERLETLSADPHNKILRWQLGVDDDILSVDTRQREFANWLKEVAGEG